MGGLWAASELPERSLADLGRIVPQNESWNATRGEAYKSINQGGTVLLYGGRTTGKTAMAVSIAIEIAADRPSPYPVPVKYVRALELLQDLRRKHNVNDAASAELVKPYRRWPFLIIDELGVRARGDAEYSESDAALITTLIDTRYQGMVGTMLISNEDRAQTFKILGPSIVRRIEQTGFTYSAKWPAFGGK